MFRSTSPVWREAPPVVSGYELNPEQGMWSVITPAGSTNLIGNPSVEFNTTGWAAHGSGSIARDATYQRRGVYALKISPSSGTTDGAYVAPLSNLLANSQYACGLDVLGIKGHQYQLSLLDVVGNSYGSKSFVATGRWERPTIVARTRNAGVYRLYIKKISNASTLPFWVDGAQLELGSYPTTYIDGDQHGALATRSDFYWNGLPHASTSTRIADCRVGGKVINLLDVGLRITAVLGLGLGGIINYTTPLANGGSVYDGSNISERQFTLVGSVGGANYQQVQRQRQALIQLLGPGGTAADQPIALRYQPLEGQQPVGDEQELWVLLKDGMAGQWDNHHQERVALQFTQFLPFVMRDAGDAADVLAYQVTVTGGYLLANVGGVWSNLGAAPDGEIRSVAIARDGTMYFGGAFTTIGGVSAARVAKRSPAGVWSALGSGIPGATINAIVIEPATQYPWFVGSFTVAGGVTVNRVTYHNGSAFVALGGTPGVDNTVNDIAFGPDGYAYVVGSFANAGGAAAANAAYWTGAAWGAMTSPGGVPTGLVIAPDGRVFVAYNGIRYWQAGSWTALSGSPTSIQGTSLYFSKAGILYGVGYINPTASLYWWGGQGWSSKTITTFPGAASVAGTQLTELDTGQVVVCFYVTSAVSWAQPTDYIFTPGANSINRYDWYTVAITGPKGSWTSYFGAGTYVVGGSNNNTVTAAGLTTVNNPGGAAVAPIFRLTGPGTVYSIRNNRTGDVIYFNLTLQAGETASLDLGQQSVDFSSNARPNLLGTILPGSTQATFKLLPGDNPISVFIGGSTTAATAAAVIFRPLHVTIDEAIPQRLIP